MAALALAVYIATLAPSITFENNGTDSGDLITAAYTLGVPHPPGYPTYTLLAWLATRLPIGTIAYRVNLISALSAALALGLACRCAQLLLPAGRPALLLSAASALTLAFSPLLWSQAVIAEVYALHTFFAVLLLWLLLRWRSGGSRANLWTAGLALGLGLGNHLTLIFAVPAAFVLLWPQRRRWLRPRALLPSLLLFLLGLGVYAYLPWAASHDPTINWGDPRSWKGFLWVVTARQYQSFVFGLPAAQISERLSTWAWRAGIQFAWLGLAVALAGAPWWWHRDRPFLLASLTWMLPLGLYAFAYNTGDAHVYLLPALLFLALWWSGGAFYILELVAHHTRQRIWQQAALILLLLLPFSSLALHWQQIDLSDDWTAYTYATQALETTRPDSLIVVRGDRPTFALWYAVYAEGQRPDVALVSGPMLAFIWYRAHMRRLYPHLVIPEPNMTEQVTTDDLVRELITANQEQVPLYASDPKETWEEWADFAKEGPIYRIQLRQGEEP